MVKARAFLASLLVVTVLTGCATWSHSSVKPTSETSSEEMKLLPTNESSIALTEEDITDRAYKVLGDIEVTVNKTTIFNKDPTREMVDQKLREEAAKLGADAVVLVRYGTVGISFMSWGSLEGRGRAVLFTE
jgi:hypothetical protein